MKKISRFLRWPCQTAINSAVGLLLIAVPLQSALAQNGVNPLSIFQNYFVTGDYIVAGWVKGAPDGSGFTPGTITVPDAMQPAQPGVPASVPTGADIVAAYLYWATVESSGTLAGQKAYFNGYPITGTILGNQQTPAAWSGEGCAGGSNGSKILHSYRADVRPFLPLDTDPKSKTYGTKIVNGAVAVRMADSGTGGGKVPVALGATLVVIYRSLAPAVPLNAIVLYDGDYAATNQVPNMSQTMIGFYQPANSPISKITHIVGNGQPTLNERVYLNNSAQPLPSIYGALPPFPGIYGTWDNPTWMLGNYVKNTDTSEMTSVVPAPTGCMAWGATILSTTVQDSDGDGLLDAWEQKQGYTDAVSKQWVPLPGANPGVKDLFVEVDWLHNLDGKAGAYRHSHLPNQQALDAVGSAFANKNINVHFDLGSGIYAGDQYVIPYPISVPSPLPAGTLAPQAGAGGNAISESQDICKDPALPGTPTTLCAFPGVPTVAWKGGFEYIKNTPTLDANNKPILGDFQPGRAKAYHYVLFGHALGTARSYWSALGTALVSKQTAQVGALVPQIISIVDSGTTATVKIQSPPGLIKPGDCPNAALKACNDASVNRISISGALTQTALDGTYIFSNVHTTANVVNNVNVSSTTTFIITTKGVASGTYNYASEPQLAVAYLGPASASGQSDFGGGGDSAVTFGLWTADDVKPLTPPCQPDPSQSLSGNGQAYCSNQVGTIPEQTGTLMHEIGHSMSLTHGGTYFNDPANPSLPFRELNCKPNFLSIMNYLFQVRGFVDGGFDFSSQTLQPLNEYNLAQNGVPALSELAGLGVDSNGNLAAHLTRFYAPQNAADKLSGNHAFSHCDGSPLGPNDVPEVRVDASVASGGNYSAPLDFNHDGTVPDAILPLPAQQVDLNYNGVTSDAPFSGYNDWESLNMRQIGSRQNAFGFSGGGVNFEGGGVNFEGGGVNFEGGGVDNDGGGVNFEGGGVNFEGGGVNFEGGGVNFEGGGIDQDLDTAASTADPATGLTCTVPNSTPVPNEPNGPPGCVLSNGTYNEEGQAVPISWTSPGFGQTRAYTIYRATSPSTSFTAIATLTGAPPATSYIDTNVDYGSTYTYYVTDTNLQGAVSGTSNSFTVTINKGNPLVVTWPTASTITYGQALSSSVLSGGSATIFDQGNVAVAGTFTFDSLMSPPHAGTALQNVTFTPTDLTDYSIVHGTVSVTVNVATPTVTWPTASTITYGQQLNSSTLGNGSASNPLMCCGLDTTVAGTFTFDFPTATPHAGTASQSVTFTPTDAQDYYSVTSTVSVTVIKATPTISVLPTATAITYGQQLSSSSLTGGSAINLFICCGGNTSVAGIFSFVTPATAPGAGTALQSVIFTPTDSADYNTASSSVNVVVNMATPTVVWPTASTITFGQTLASSTLTGGSASYVLWSGSAAVPGTIAFTVPATMPGAGTAPQNVTFTPTDATDYNSVTGTVSVTVNKATPKIVTLPTATAITYGQTLASSTLSGGSASYTLSSGSVAVSGSFAFTTPTKAPGAGTALQSVIFIPTDSTDYNTATGANIFTSSVSVKVNPATPAVSWPTAGQISCGQTLGSAILSGGSALNGVTPVVGTFTFPAAATAPPVGTALWDMTFTPTDSTDYNLVQGTGVVSVTVIDPNPGTNDCP